ncbi:MAG: hypothetical protein RJA70_3486 [Pseudomonadota bacterium]|jgi:D-alanyl-lipoteichoic acid acyltransferase DltB (MBOAT superfamily)
MLFNSYEFLFFFLPITLCVYHGLHRLRLFQTALAALVAASVLYYGWATPSFLLLLIPSIAANFVIGRTIQRRRTDRAGDLLLFGGVALNLALIGYFKYTDFAIEVFNHTAGATIPRQFIELPLGISFFTFQQIAFLADCRYKAFQETSVVHYSLFVTFFPQLIAGPIVHPQEMLPQFQGQAASGVKPWLGFGLTTFVIGLLKKVVCADSMADIATPIFDAAAGGKALTLFEAWGGTLCYSLQLYFDFSGYSDMAIGLGALFGILLPLNFASPYKAVDIADFWRRWHITLSRFLRDYLYIPLGGNQRGPTRRYVNLMLTMLLGGLWHGAGFNFVLWGGLHGLFLGANHAYRAVWSRLGFRLSDGGSVGGRLLTFVALLVAWVPFRAANTDTTLAVWRAMIGENGAVLPRAWLDPLGVVSQALAYYEVQFKGKADSTEILLAACMLVIVWVAPNTQEIVARPESAALPPLRLPVLPSFPALRWRPTWRWAVVMAVAAFIGIMKLDQVSEFIYYQF